MIALHNSCLTFESDTITFDASLRWNAAKGRTLCVFSTCRSIRGGGGAKLVSMQP